MTLKGISWILLKLFFCLRPNFSKTWWLYVESDKKLLVRVIFQFFFWETRFFSSVFHKFPKNGSQNRACYKQMETDFLFLVSLSRPWVVIYFYYFFRWEKHYLVEEQKIISLIKAICLPKSSLFLPSIQPYSHCVLTGFSGKTSPFPMKKNVSKNTT